MPLNDLVEKYQEAYNISDISGLEDMTVDGILYGLPMELNTRHLFYRPDLLEKHGVEVPETWDDVIAACGVLHAEESTVLPFTIQLHAGWAWRSEFKNMLLGFGGKSLNDDNTPAFNSEEGVMALEKMVEIVDACMGAEGLTYSIDDSQIGIATGELAMAFTWASRAASMDDPDFSDYVGGINFAPAPRATEDGLYASTGGTGAGLGIPANIDDDPDLVFQVIMEAMDTESQVRGSAVGVISRSEVAAQADARYLEAVFETIRGWRLRLGSTSYWRRFEPGSGSMAAADRHRRNVHRGIAGRRRRCLHSRSDRSGIHRGLASIKVSHPCWLATRVQACWANHRFAPTVYALFVGVSRWLSPFGFLANPISMIWRRCGAPCNVSKRACPRAGRSYRSKRDTPSSASGRRQSSLPR